MASIDKDECFEWLNSKEPNSVVYVCFGSLAPSFPTQVQEIALALEASGLDFIWAITKKLGKEKEEVEKEELELLPKGFEERVKGKGLIIKGWAPQVSILDHEAVGGFLTHCGWNSILESISSGVPMATWPLFAEQFFNEKLDTDVLRVGVKVGSKVWNGMAKGIVLKRAEIEVALTRVMVGEEALDMTNRANKLKEMAHKAVEEGGSSFCELNTLINELKELSRQ